MPQGHVAHQARADGFFQAGAAFGDPGLVVALFDGVGHGNFPILVDFELVAASAGASDARHELADAGEQSLFAASSSRSRDIRRAAILRSAAEMAGCASSALISEAKANKRPSQ